MKSLFFNKLKNVGKKIKINFIQILIIFLVYVNLDFFKSNINVKAIHTKKNLFIPVSNEIFYFKKNVLIKKRNKEKRYTHSKNKGSNIFLNLNEENDNTLKERKKKIKYPEIGEYNDDVNHNKNNDNNGDDSESHLNDQGKCKFSDLKQKGIKYMTKIQSQSFKPIYEGKDIIGRSETGSGKTLAFALPLVEKLYKMKTFNEKFEEENGSHEEDQKKNIYDDVDNDNNYDNFSYGKNIKIENIIKIHPY
ncbi:hypothetical protein PFLG_01088 [Plasmodium falciparum RAJ116]|uniref:DEAD/DEAH-box helicase domain-containing protein n=1 Tax=Plasmodium falciparum RAJ116 TaxID=580058 RepID=A0A0L0CY20_PLAFA|nr:hypothetical protein PFLG_01088 [Plasmodium falciparum RAJ116]